MMPEGTADLFSFDGMRIPERGELLTITAFGLDFAGFSTGGSGLARAVRDSSGKLDVTVYEGHCFAEKIGGFEAAGEVMRREREMIVACLVHSTLTVDIPIDLQGLPNVEPQQFIWELTLRPVDCAFDARPPLADRIGAPVSRFAPLISPLQSTEYHPLAGRLFESYPAASLQLMRLHSRRYKGRARFQVVEGWIPVDDAEDERVKSKKEETEEARQRRSQKKTDLRLNPTFRTSRLQFLGISTSCRIQHTLT